MRLVSSFRFQICLALLLAAVAASFQPVQGQAAGHAAVVVTKGDGSDESRCVAFESEEITGLELLRRSGFEAELDVKGFGSAVCRIDGVGCAADDCFCECSGGSDCVYWSYWHLKENSWQYAAAGAGSYRVKNGDVEGWTWGTGSLSGAVEPPAVSFQEICGDSENLAVITAPTEDGSQDQTTVPIAIAAVLSAATVYGVFRFRRRESKP